MEKNKKYSINEFFVGELYFAVSFGNLLVNQSIQEGMDKITSFTQSGAINFQQNLMDKYIDWENRREYTGFLTIFYKQGSKYICLHDGIAYELSGVNFIDNLVPLSELLPQIDTQTISSINMYRALQLFDILFNKNKDMSQLYLGEKQLVSDFYVGDISLKEMYRKEQGSDSRRKYIDLPQHYLLDKSGLTLYSFRKSDYVSTVYRCLFLRQGVDLYNVNNNQFYNHNEDKIQGIVDFREYITNFGIKTQSSELSIPKALKLFKRTI